MAAAASRLSLALVLAGPAAGCRDYLVGQSFDAPLPARFSIAYLDREEVREDDVAWRIKPAIGLVINTSSTGLDPARLRVVSVDDDSPRVDLSFSIEDAISYTLPPGHAGGRVAGGLKWIRPLVTEPLHLGQAPSLQYRIDYLDPPPHRFAATVHATVVLELDGELATLPFEVRILDVGDLGGGTLGARRVWSAPER